MQILLFANGLVSVAFIVVAAISLVFPRKTHELVARRYKLVAEQRRRAGREPSTGSQAEPGRKALTLVATVAIVVALMMLAVDIRYFS
jgi:hypothetical protein